MIFGELVNCGDALKVQRVRPEPFNQLIALVLA
jgi:hypothetical protein